MLWKREKTIELVPVAAIFLTAPVDPFED